MEDNKEVKPDFKTHAHPAQLCPKCHGQGTVTKPPYVPGDVSRWDSSSTSFQCNVCNGNKIIPQYLTIEPYLQSQLQQTQDELRRAKELLNKVLNDDSPCCDIKEKTIQEIESFLNE